MARVKDMLRIRAIPGAGAQPLHLCRQVSVIIYTSSGEPSTFNNTVAGTIPSELALLAVSKAMLAIAMRARCRSILLSTGGSPPREKKWTC